LQTRSKHTPRGKYIKAYIRFVLWIQASSKYGGNTILAELFKLTDYLYWSKQLTLDDAMKQQPYKRQYRELSDATKEKIRQSMLQQPQRSQE